MTNKSNEIKPLVSLVMITYNHEKFISEAIEGVLIQVVDFPVEFIIADDCSPDKTQEIVQGYIDTHPKGHWINYTRHSTNKGMMPNFIWALKQARGKYIALCEGDDYWTDPLKLQKQVDFLEENEEYVCVGACNEVLNESTLNKNRFEQLTSYYGELSVDELFFGYPVHTSTVVFKKNALDADFYETIGDAPAGDLFLFTYLASKGRFFKLPDSVSCYRLSDGGVSLNHDLIWALKMFTSKYDFYKAYLKPNKKIKRGLVLEIQRLIDQAYIAQKREIHKELVIILYRKRLFLHTSIRWQLGNIRKLV